MAIVLEVNYAKKLGLPNYSSHQYSVTIRTELTDLTQIEEASTRLYGLLQDAVDREIQHVGFLPDASTYGMNPSAANGNGADQPPRGNGSDSDPNAGHTSNGNGWNCSEKQRNFIEKIVREHRLDKRKVEELAVEMFSVGVRQLDRLQASGLIDELLERHGGGRRGGKRSYRRERVPANGGDRG
ncbi:MAG: hypothetical protein QOE70_1626 [Chthoniobacter sp.]|jgi:hypothetical protein|nr:hypothetical protein [Chthoniobacter sp.]